jgi:hypothetical protein
MEQVEVAGGGQVVRFVVVDTEDGDGGEEMGTIRWSMKALAIREASNRMTGDAGGVEAEAVDEGVQRFRFKGRTPFRFRATIPILLNRSSRPSWWRSARRRSPPSLALSPKTATRSA